MFATLRRLAFEGLLDNLGLKFVSLLCAIGFFIFIRGSERAELRFDVGVAHSEPAESARRILVKEPPTEVSVTLRGPRAQLESLPRDLGTITLDLSTGHEGVIELSALQIPNVPPGVEVVQIFPAKIDVRWDDVITRDLPVQTSVTGQPAEGHSIVGTISLAPETVKATGPRSIMDLMQSARASSFDASEMTEGRQTKTLKLDLPPQGVSYSADSVQGTIQIVRQEKSVKFKAVRVEVVGAPKATTRPETVAVKVRGVADLIAGLDTEQIVPRVELPPDVDITKPGSRMVKVLLDIPNTSVEVEPKEVLVKW